MEGDQAMTTQRAIVRSIEILSPVALKVSKRCPNGMTKGRAGTLQVHLDVALGHLREARAMLETGVRA
jgi:hypothetical protein